MAVIYASSYFLSYISIKYFSGLDAFWEAKRLNSIHDEILYSLPWQLQLVGVAIVTMLLLARLNIISFEPNCITYCFLAAITYIISMFIAYNYIIIRINSIIYGIDAGIMGWKGTIEEFVARLLVAFPLFFIISVTTRVKSKNLKSLTVANASIYIAIFVADTITTDFWFPPLVNYGS